jgi:hypothetical protein
MIKNIRTFIVELEDCTQEGVSTDISTEEDLIYFENETGLKLPPDYKEFCKIIGTANLGGFIEIFTPSFKMSEMFVNLIQENLGTQIEDGETNDLDLDFVTELLNFTFIFGRTGNAEHIVWDLRTYRKSDQSYDIYLIPAHDIENVYLIGRDFNIFLQEFCFGTSAFELLPSFRQPEQIYQAYSRFQDSLKDSRK